MDNEAKMQIIKQAMSEGYKGNFTDLIIQQEEAMQKQNQEQEQPEQVQEQPQQQPMPGGMEMPEQVNGDLVQSYQDAPPGISNNPTGGDVSNVVTDANQYKDGGAYRVSEMIEYENGGPKVSDKAEKIRNDVKTMNFKRYGGVSGYVSKYQKGGMKMIDPNANEGSGDAKVGRTTQSTLDYSKGEQKTQETMGEVQDIANWAPVAGEIIDAKHALTDLKNKDYTGAALNAAGFALPFVPGGALKKGYKYLKNNTFGKKLVQSDDKLYRGIGPKGYTDLNKSGVLRANQDPTKVMSGSFDITKRFNNTYVSPNASTAVKYGDGVVAEINKNSAKFSNTYSDKSWSMFTRDKIPVDQVNTYKKNLFGTHREFQKGGFKSKYEHGGKHEEKTEGQRRRELNSAIANVSTNERETKILESTNFVENSMGYNHEAYNRGYTNSQASIDPITFTDLFSPRIDEKGKSQGYSNTQKKYFKRFKEMGLPTDSTGFKKELNKDNPVAAVEAMRMVYGRTPEAIPEVTDTLGMFHYYNDNYRKNNNIKDLSKSKKRFYEGYKMDFKK
tara:strand:- start:6403 stop:8073 length:1671 start_codon:yes stop_codon:yes gene_type:complete